MASAVSPANAEMRRGSMTSNKNRPVLQREHPCSSSCGALATSDNLCVTAARSSDPRLDGSRSHHVYLFTTLGGTACCLQIFSVCVRVCVPAALALL